MKQRGIVGIFILVLVLVLAVAGGTYYYFGRTSTRLQPIKTQQPAQITPSPDPTTNWKTYTNTKYNYSVRYPPEWNVYELVAHRDFEVSSTIESDRVDFAKGGVPYPLENDYWIWVSIVPNANQLSIEQVVDSYLNEIPEVVDSITKDYLTVSGTNAISLYPVPSATDTKHVYVATKENIYSIVLQAGSLPDLNQGAMNTFNMILSTFKFTSQ